MSQSTSPAQDLRELLEGLAAAARRRGLTDSAWAAAAGLRKETLSRLRRRHDCDFSTIRALSRAAGIDLMPRAAAQPHRSTDGHLPAGIDRDYEERLVELAVSGSTDAMQWLALGPGFFMAGLAMLLASLPGFERQACVALAERLHPGSSRPEVLGLWLRRSPLRVDRFAPMLEQRRRHAG